MLRAGRGDYLLDYSLPVDYSQLQLEKPVTMEAMLIKQLQMHLLVSKKTPHAQVVSQRLNEALQRLLARGELELLKNYNPKATPITKSP